MLSLNSSSAVRSSPSSDGFTLIEVLVAISILAIALVVILQLFSGALKSSRLSHEYTRGIFYAQEKMDEILLREVLTSGVEEGEFEDDAYQWRVEIVQIDQPEDEASEIPFHTFQIVVDVFWGGDISEAGKHFQLSTIKVVKKPKDKKLEKPGKNESRE
ncbi:MAG: prepilin-type N-terminal cleavage/methylation domain-containing protein [Syntrophaceae bacterium]|nr:prepilin-type N-terminal cleavage/methylation domain-containing protein [Syntrophaceae bacterium]